MDSSLAFKISSEEGNSERVNSETLEYKSPKTPLYSGNTCSRTA